MLVGNKVWFGSWTPNLVSAVGKVSFKHRTVVLKGLNMEAIAKHDFNATADDELSFRKNQVLKVCENLFKYVDV